MMNKLQVFIFGFCFVIFGCKNAPEYTVKENSTNSDSISFMRYAKESKTLVSAHRGGKNLDNYPENSLEALDYLCKKGIRVFEIDVNKTQDGVIILMHDNSINRTTNGKGKVSMLNYKEILEKQLKDHRGKVLEFKVPTFQEALHWAKKNKAFLMVDIKRGVSYKKVVQEIRSKQMESQVVLIAYSVNQANRLHKLAPEIVLSVPMRNMIEFKKMMQSRVPTNKMIAFTGTKLSPKELYQTIQNKDMLSILGTLGNLDKRAKARGNQLYVEYANLGVNIFATDRPLAVLKVLEE